MNSWGEAGVPIQAWLRHGGEGKVPRLFRLQIHRVLQAAGQLFHALLHIEVQLVALTEPAISLISLL